MLDRTDFYVSGSLNHTDSPPSTATSTSTSPETDSQQLTFGLNMCQACKQEFRGKVGKAREELWSLLPRWFGLVGLENQEVEVEV